MVMTSVFEPISYGGRRLDNPSRGRKSTSSYSRFFSSGSEDPSTTAFDMAPSGDTLSEYTLDPFRVKDKSCDWVTHLPCDEGCVERPMSDHGWSTRTLRPTIETSFDDGYRKPEGEIDYNRGDRGSMQLDRTFNRV